MATKKRQVKKAGVKKKTPAKKAPDREQQANLWVALAGDSKRARMMAEAPPFRAVPTIFTSFNRASQVAGAPLSCVWLVHGPSAGGKTAFLCGLIRGFQAINAAAAFVDAEQAADTKRWFRHLGVDPTRCLYVGRTEEGERDVPPLTYEETTEEVDGLLSRFSQGKRDGTIHPETPMIVVVDSISKMVPADLLKAVEKKGGEGLRSGPGRLQALLNNAWLMDLGVKVGSAEVLMAIIAHESESQSANRWTADWKVRGGASLIYDSMMQVRVTFAGQVKDLSSDGAPVVGKRHRVKIYKNKHGRPYEEAVFYTSNGTGLAPIGFDRTREVVHEGLVRGLVKGPDPAKTPLTSGARLEFDGVKYQLKQLYTNPTAQAAVDALASELDRQLFSE